MFRAAKPLEKSKCLDGTRAKYLLKLSHPWRLFWETNSGLEEQVSGNPFFAPDIHTAGTVKHQIHLEVKFIACMQDPLLTL